MQTEQEQRAEAISKHILKSNSPIENLNQEQLTSLVDKEFDHCGLNYIMVGNFNGYGVHEVRLKLETNGPLHGIDEVTELVNREVKTYLGNLEKECQTYKNLTFSYLRAYQDEQKRKNETNPFSN